MSTLSASTPLVAGGARHPLTAVFRAELLKLSMQLSTRLLALACALGPLAFGAILSLQSGVPADTLLGIWVHSSGYSVSFVVLGFADFIGFSVIAGVLAGDIFSSEDRYGTWKTVLTRSRSRWELFAGKLMAVGVFAVALLALTALSSLLSGLIFTGSQPLVGLGGTVLSSGEALWLASASWMLSLPPLLAFVSIAVLFSIATRNSIVGVLSPILVAFVMQLLVLVGNGSWMHYVVVVSAFEDWSGLLAAPRFYGPLLIGTAVSLLWALACLSASWLILRRRDFAGPPVVRRAGWALPLRVALISVVVLVGLGAAGSLGPVAVTRARLQASIAPIFDRLTLLQQRELGRTVPSGTTLNARPTCLRHTAHSEGPGDDWSCAIVIFRSQPGAEPFQQTPVTYDLSVKSNGCYKAEAPPAFVGQQTMRDAHDHNVVNPLFTIYGCFDTTGSAGAASAPTAGVPATSRTRSRPSAAERQALRAAERAAGPTVMRKIEEAERRGQREAETPVEEASPVGGSTR